MDNSLIKVFKLQIDKNSFIKEIIDHSDEYTKRAKVKFKNGFKLSIITGKFAYGDEEEPFEIAPFDKNGFKPSLFDEEDSGDDVLGYCDVEKVKYYINKIGNMNRE